MEPGTVHAVSPLTVRLDSSVTEQPAINMSSVTLVVTDRVDVEPIGPTSTSQQLHILGSERSAVPAGVIWMFGGATAPAGWLVCDGSAVSRATYAVLFAAIGTAYGAGDGSTTFGLPSPLGKSAVGQDPAQTEFATLGQVGGEKTHLLTTPEIPSHTHIQDTHNHTQDTHNHLQNAHGHIQNPHGHNISPDLALIDTTPTAGTGINRYVVASGTEYQSADAVTPTDQATTAVNQTTVAVNQTTVAVNQVAGGGVVHNNLSPYLVVNFIVKT